MNYVSPDIMGALGNLGSNQVADVPGMRALSVPGFDGMQGWGQPNSIAGTSNFNPSPLLPAATDDAIAAATGQGGGGGFGDWFKNSGFLTSTDKNGLTTQGWGGMALGGIQGAANLFMGMQQYGLAKKQLEESRRQFDLNYGAAKTTTNTRLEDRQRARVASNAGAYQSVGDYMSQHGVK